MKKLVLLAAGLSLVLSACSNDKDPKKQISPTEIQSEAQKAAQTEATTKKLTENDFCRMDSLDRLEQVLNFDYSEVDAQTGESAQLVKMADVDVHSDQVNLEQVIGSWTVEGESVMVKDDVSGKSVKYNLVFTEELGILTGMMMNPEDTTEIAAVYEVCGAKAKVAERRELQKEQLQDIEEFHAEHGM